jgi:hypothetical protein
MLQGTRIVAGIPIVRSSVHVHAVDRTISEAQDFRTGRAREVYDMSIRLLALRSLDWPPQNLRFNLMKLEAPRFGTSSSQLKM